MQEADSDRVPAIAPWSLLADRPIPDELEKVPDADEVEMLVDPTPVPEAVLVTGGSKTTSPATAPK